MVKIKKTAIGIKSFSESRKQHRSYRRKTVPGQAKNSRQRMG